MKSHVSCPWRTRRSSSSKCSRLGNVDSRTIDLLSQGCLSSLFVQLKDQFDFVIVDSSPLLPVADGLILAQHVDAVLFSIFRNVSRKAEVADALGRLSHLGVPILGAVVTGCKPAAMVTLTIRRVAISRCRNLPPGRLL